MPKTVAISDDTHILVNGKQLELFSKYRVTAKIADIVDAAIKYGINNVDSVFVPNDVISMLKIVDKEHVRNGEIKMDLKEVKCGNCGKEIYILEDRVREKMFCTLGCLEESKVVSKEQVKKQMT